MKYSRWLKTENLFFIFAFIFLNVVSAIAGPSRTTYQAKIIKPDGYPLETTNVNFKFTVLDPAGSCILYSETYSSVNMANTGGLISFSLGSGVKVYPVSATTFENVFSNITPNLSCDAGGPASYSPASSDVRKLVMQFHDGNGWQTLPAMSINAVPYAMYANDAEKLNGKTDADFVQVSTLPMTCGVSEALRFNGAAFSCIAVGSGGTAVTSGSVITALGYTPADGASVTTLSSSLSSTNSDVSAVSATVNGLASNLASVSSTVFSVSSTVSSLSTSFSNLATTVSGLSASMAAITSSQWLTSGTTISYNTGNVGIGTTTPVTKLDIAGGIRIGSESATCAAGFAGTLRYNAGVVEYCNGTSWAAFGISGAGILAINGLASGSQTFAFGATGNSPNVSSVGSVHTFNFPFASVGTTTAGVISYADYLNFSNKITSSAASIAQVLGYTPASASALANYLVKTNNLSDLASSASARTNLGLGGAALLNVGTSAGTVAAGNDSRIVNALQTTTNFSGDVSGTYNALNLVNSGVSAGTYTSVTVDVKGRVTSGSSSVSVSAITGVLPLANGGTGSSTSAGARTNLGLGSIATYNQGNTVGTVPTLGTAGLTSGSICTSPDGNTISCNTSIASLSQWTTSATTIYYNTGNVGVGTTTPSFPLSVSGTIQGRGIGYFTQSSPVNSLAIDATSSTLHSIYTNAPSVDLSLGTNNSTSQLYIKNNGNVGIGATTPVTKLDVSGGVRISMESATCVASYAGTLRYNSGSVEYCNGSTWSAFGVAGSGITSMNGSTSGSQSFAVGTMGTAPAFVTANGVHTFNIPLASAGSVTAGLVSNADYVNFSNKITSSAASIAQVLGYVPASATALGNYLAKASNLSDLASSATARTNLGVGYIGTLSSVDLSSSDVSGTLAIARTPAYAGDITKAAASNTLILSNTGVTAGTYNKVTVDAKGRVTSSSSLTSGDVTTALGYTPAASGSFTSSQWTTSGSAINYVAGNVGIGTASPGSKLDVVGNEVRFLASTDAEGVKIHSAYSNNETSSRLMFAERQDNAYGWSLVDAGVANPALGGTTLTGIVSSSFNIVRHDGSAAGVPAVSIDRFTGNIGIGNAAPTMLMDLYGSASPTLRIRSASNDPASGPTIRLVEDASENGAVIRYQALTNSLDLGVVESGVENMPFSIFRSTGRIGIGGVTSATAKLHLGSGTTTVAPLKLTSGTLLSAAQPGALEYDGVDFYITDGAGTRRTVATATTAGTLDNVSVVSSPAGIALWPAAGNSVTVSATTASTNSSTGALIVKGGLGVAGNIYSSGTIITTSNIQGSEITATSATITPYIYGSIVSGGSLRLESTTHASKGNITLAVSGGNVGIGTNSPTALLNAQVNSSTYVQSLFRAQQGGSFSAMNDYSVNFQTYGNRSALGNGTQHGLYVQAGWDSDINETEIARFSALNGGYSDVPRVVIKSSGKIGVGTSSPTVSLDIQGGSSVNGSNGIRVLSTNSSGNNNALIEAIGKRSDGNVYGTFAGTLALAKNRTDAATSTNGGALGRIMFGGNHTDGSLSNLLYATSIQGIAEGTFSDANTMPSGLAFYTGSAGYTTSQTTNHIGTERLRISSSGNVGVGTTNPAAKLHLNGSDSRGITLSPGTTTQRIDFLHNDNGNVNAIYANIRGVLEDGSAGRNYGHLVLATAPNTAGNPATVERVRITGNGDVGIGTTAPVTKLDVNETTAVSSTLGSIRDISAIYGNAGSGNSRLITRQVRTESGGTSHESSRFMIQRKVDSSDMGFVAFNGGGTDGGGTANRGISLGVGTTDYFTMIQNGNIGMGTTNPQEKLHVEATTGGRLQVGTGNIFSATGYGTSLESDTDDGVVYLNAHTQAAGANVAAISIRAGHGSGESATSRTIVTFKTNTGNVGIGTTTPDKQLTMHSTGVDNYIHLTSSLTGTTALDGVMIGTGSSGDAAFYNRESTNMLFLTSNTERVRIDPTGNVGIGTGAPSALLHVSTSTANDVSGQLQIENTNAGTGALVNSQLISKNKYGTMQFMNWENFGGRIGYRSAGGSSGNLYFTTGSDVIATTILANGNVGIGTTAPGSILHLANVAPYVTYEETDTTQKFFTGVDGSGYWIRQGTTANADLITIKNTGNVGIGTAAPAYKLDVAGTLRGFGITDSSDIRLKKQIQPLDLSLEKILSINGVSYYWKDTSMPKKQIGFIAQDLEKVYPELVETDPKGMKSVNYSHLIAPLIEAFKALYAKVVVLFDRTEKNAREIASVKEENAELKVRIEKTEKENQELKLRLERIEKAVSTTE